MKLKNILIAVNDIEKSKKFYREVFGLDVVLDGDENVILTEGLVLQDKKVWENHLRQEVVCRNNASELYFEEKKIEEFVEKLEKLYPDVHYVTPLTECEWGQKVVRFYDLDGTLIEVRN